MAKKQDRELDARWDDVRVFLAAHRQRSLGAAATKLGVDTSTVSRRVAAFERTLGVKLFERTRDGLLETRAATRVLAAAEAMEAAQARLTRDATDVERTAEGTVRVSAAPGMTDVFIAPTLARLRAKHPKIVIELDASTRALDLARHEADVALRSVEPQGAELVVKKLGTATWVPASSAAYGKKVGTLRSWNDATWITWDRDFGSFGPAKWISMHAPKGEVALRTSHFSSQIAAAKAGLGIALVPRPYLERTGLVALASTRALAPTLASLPADSLWLVGHRILRDVPRIAAVWQFLSDELRPSMPR